MTAINNQAGASGAIASLDGIRAVAITLVFFAHSGLENIVPGGLGVTIFFVLSGYLITTLLRREFAASGTLDYRAFYLRRCLRLMPPLLIVTAAAALLSIFGVVEGGFSRSGLLSVLFYLGNYFVIAHDFHGIPGGLGVIWSLAVEEHYYLLYPPLALLLLRRSRPAASAAVLASLCAVVLLRRCWLAAHGAGEPQIGMASDTRVDAILIGCIMGLWRNPCLDRPVVVSSRAAALLGLACLAALAASLLYRSDLFRLTLRYTVQSLAVAPLIYLAVARAEHRPWRWLNSRPLVYLGTVSYTVYLSHQVILFMIERNWPLLGWTGTTLSTALITLGVAELMRRGVEQPCARLRRRLHHAAPAPEQAATPIPARML